MPAPLISINAAQPLVLDAVSPLGTETVAIDDALGRVLAKDVSAAGDVPPFPCSAMDGYAVTAGEAGRTLAIVGEARAGTPSSRPPARGGGVPTSPRAPGP